MPIRYKVSQFITNNFSIDNAGSGYTEGNVIKTSSPFTGEFIIDSVDGTGAILSLVPNSSLVANTVNNASPNSANLQNEFGRYKQQAVRTGDSTGTLLDTGNINEIADDNNFTIPLPRIFDISYDGKSYIRVTSSVTEFVKNNITYTPNIGFPNVSRRGDGIYQADGNSTTIQRWTGSGLSGNITINETVNNIDSIDTFAIIIERPSLYNSALELKIKIFEWNGSSYNSKIVTLNDGFYTVSELATSFTEKQSIVVNKNADTLVVNQDNTATFYSISGTSLNFKNRLNNGRVQMINDSGTLAFAAGDRWYRFDGSNYILDTKNKSAGINSLTPDLRHFSETQILNSSQIEKTIFSISSDSDTTFTSSANYITEPISGTDADAIEKTVSEFGNDHNDIIDSFGFRSTNGSNASITAGPFSIREVKLQNTYAGENIGEITLSFSGDSPTINAPNQVETIDGVLPDEISITDGGEGYTNANNINVSITNITGKFS